MVRVGEKVSWTRWRRVGRVYRRTRRREDARVKDRIGNVCLVRGLMPNIIPKWNSGPMLCNHCCGIRAQPHTTKSFLGVRSLPPVLSMLSRLL